MFWSVKTISVAMAILSAAAGAMAADSSATVDSVVFGDAVSEQPHHFAGDRSQIIKGGLGEPARQLLPLAPTNWKGGSMAFTLKVDPEKQNYATIRLWGSDATRDILILFCEGNQIGYRHLGDVDLLDFGSSEPAFNGRFFYNTTPLPLAMTRGQTNLNFEIRSTGPTWGYASTFDVYQKPMTEPTRGIYKIYTHTDACFIPPAGETQGDAVANPPVRKGPGAEVLDALKSRVNGEVNKLLASKSPLNQPQMQFLANAYSVKWSSTFQNPKAVAQVLKSLDALFVAYRKNPKLAESDPATYNPDWFGLGMAGDAIHLLTEQLKPSLEEMIDDGGGKKIARRAAYSEMLVACRDWHHQHRRLYTNQTMINDLYGIYLCNRGVEVVDPASALPENEVRRYLYESVGLEPWRDSDGVPSWSVGTNYWQLTPKGLTKELGYTGYYGEVLDWVTAIYDATRPAPGQPGDEKIRAQLEKIAHARAVFRYPGVDAEGNRAMRIEAIVGWRDEGHYPGDIAYGQRTSWDGSALGEVAATLDPQSTGYAQQMFADNQFFALLQGQLKETGFRVTAGLLGVPDQYELLKTQPPSAARLPMTPSQPDFVFSDEVDGVVAIKNGNDVLYASLYWRARNAVNFLARVHYTTPAVDRIAVVHEEAQFEPDGRFYTQPDWINFDFGNGGPRYPVTMHAAQAGEKLPIAKIPAGVKFRPGDESVYAGKGSFYTLRYGDYLIGMNLTADQTFELKTPDDVKSVRELVSKTGRSPGEKISVPPQSTVVLYLNH